ncbi:FAD-dependent oxidoreductase [Brachybacterium phenoliresistens]|uniref:FAD-dependent oxidoreductase n=1 Tax=Brachybacterium phenoliresistens TaxID=396014 RepID=UPI0031D8FB4E
MEILVVGAGVSGLAVAHELAAHHRVTVLEAAPGPRGGGSMIDLFGPGFDAAERIGVLPALRSRGRLLRGVRYEAADGTPTGRLDAAPLVEAAGGRCFSILRPEIEQALLSCLPGGARIRYGARVDAVRDAGGDHAEVVLADGGVLGADLVVGCDGVRSAVRAAVAPQHAAVIPMGFRAASFLLEAPRLAAELGDWALMTDTVGRIGGLYACDARRIALFLAERTDRRDVSRPVPDRDRLQRTYQGLHPLIDAVLPLCPETFYDDLVAQSAAPRWSTGRLVLAGDAAHAVSLLAGQGASLAIAGAEALGRSLRASGPHIGAVLAEYERRFRPVVERAQSSGRRSASAFIPATAAQLRMQQLGRRALGVPGIARLLTRRFIAA